MSRRWSLAWFSLALAVACAEPPNRELHQAQGAIEAARAAGADQYAPVEMKAAVAALTSAQQAVEQRDYRLALNHALDARERAQEAAKQAANQKAVVRSEVERSLGQVAAAAARAAARLKQAEAARVPRARLEAPRQSIVGVETAVQEARAAVQEGRYLEARDLLTGSADRVDAASREIEALVALPPGRRRR